MFWDDFRITKNQPVGPVYLRITNHSLKNNLEMQLLLTIVPKGVFIHDVLNEITKHLLPLCQLDVQVYIGHLDKVMPIHFRLGLNTGDIPGSNAFIGKHFHCCLLLNVL